MYLFFVTQDLINHLSSALMLVLMVLVVSYYNYNDNIEHPVYFINRFLTKSGRNYAITELEGTTAYYCINQFRSYILSNPFQIILYTDYLPLVSIIKKLEPAASKHARWCNLFSQLQVNIVYQPGKGSIIADAL